MRQNIGFKELAVLAERRTWTSGWTTVLKKSKEKQENALDEEVLAAGGGWKEVTGVNEVVNVMI